MNWPKITVVTPSYKQGKYLEETILSVLNQNYPNLEYIIIDGGSSDKSVEIIQKYAHHLAYWISEPDKGQADAINKGFARSTGDIMGWLNSDDLLLPGSLHAIAQAFQANPQTMIVTGFRKVYNADSRFLHNYFDALPHDNLLRIKCSVAQEATYWRREVYETIGPLDASFQYALDFAYWQRMLDAGFHFTQLPVYIGGFRIHAESKGETLNHIRDAELSRLYQSRNIASNEAEAFKKLDNILGKNWEDKLYLLHRFGRRKLSNNPHLMLLAQKILFAPVLSDALLSLYRFIGHRRG